MAFKRSGVRAPYPPLGRNAPPRIEQNQPAKQAVFEVLPISLVTSCWRPVAAIFLQWFVSGQRPLPSQTRGVNHTAVRMALTHAFALAVTQVRSMRSFDSDRSAHRRTTTWPVDARTAERFAGFVDAFATKG